MKFSLIIISIMITAFSLYGNDQLKEVKTKIDQLNNEQLINDNPYLVINLSGL